VKNLIRLIQSNVSVSPTASGLIRASRRTGVISGVFYVVLGFMFAGWGLYGGLSFIAALGGAFVVFGIVTVVRVLRITPANASKT
jgi:uncharacterized membrane protein HdeD (DUF308 family)